MNDWAIGKFLTAVLAIQLTTCVAVVLDVPVVKQVVGFICFSFIPGVFLLRILRVRKINSIETILLPYENTDAIPHIQVILKLSRACTQIGNAAVEQNHVENRKR